MPVRCKKITEAARRIFLASEVGAAPFLPQKGPQVIGGNRLTALIVWGPEMLSEAVSTSLSDATSVSWITCFADFVECGVLCVWWSHS